LSELRMLDDKYFYANIGLEEDSLIKKCSAPYELLWAFMEEKYSLLLKESSEGEETFDDVSADNFFFEFIEKLSKMPVQIYVLYATDIGQTFLTKNLVLYDELGYFYRLIHHMKKSGVNTLKLFSSLYEEKYDFREKILRNVLRKNSILRHIEQFAFRMVMRDQRISMGNILKFTIEYEQIIRVMK